jgi:hypothetical protein
VMAGAQRGVSVDVKRVIGIVGAVRLDVEPADRFDDDPHRSDPSWSTPRTRNSSSNSTAVAFDMPRCWTFARPNSNGEVARPYISAA